MQDHYNNAVMNSIRGVRRSSSAKLSDINFTVERNRNKHEESHHIYEQRCTFGGRNLHTLSPTDGFPLRFIFINVRFLLPNMRRKISRMQKCGIDGESHFVVVVEESTGQDSRSINDACKIEHSFMSITQRDH